MNVDWSRSAQQDREQLLEDDQFELVKLVWKLADSRDALEHRIEPRNGDGGLHLYVHPDPPYSISFQVENNTLRVVGVDLADVRLPRKLFISYAHEDRPRLDEIRKILRPGEDERNVEIWWDGKIEPGDSWEKVLKRNLNASSLGLLLVSGDFLASDFIRKTEVPLLEQRRQTDNVRLVWLHLSDCLWEEWPLLRELQALRDPEVALDNLRGPRRRKAVRQICRKVLDMMPV